MKKPGKLHGVLVAIVSLAAAAPQALDVASAADWPQWRGLHRDGSVPGFDAPQGWPKSLSQRWQVPVGAGYSSPVIAGDRVFLHAREGDRETVSCYRLEDGRRIWTDEYAAPGKVHPAGAAHGIGPKSTPALANGRLFTLGIGSILSCYRADSDEAEVIWRKDFSGHFPKPAPSCGTSMSPLLVDDMCIVHVGVDASGELIAFDAATGTRKWTYDGDGPGYGSPVLAARDGRRHLVAPVSKFIAGFSLENGKPLWRIPFPTRSTQNILTPVVDGERLFIGGIGQDTSALRIPDQDRPSESNEEDRIWRNTRAPLHMSSMVLVNGRLLGLSSRRKGQLFCIDAESGEGIWTSPGDFAEFATILHGGGHVIVLTGNGRLLFLDDSAESFAPLATYRVSESRTWAQPAVAGGRILVKDETNLTCWDLSPAK